MPTDFEKHVPMDIRPRFIQAFKGTFGYWFEFDGSVRFEDRRGGGGGGGNSPSPTGRPLTSAV